MRILFWDVRPAWSAAFTEGAHEYLMQLGSTAPRPDQDIDLVILQRPLEFDLVRDGLGRTPGVDVPAVYLEHDLPPGRCGDDRHPAADQRGTQLVHVSAFHRLVWDNGSAPTVVIEPGIVDPGPRYSGEVAAAALVADDPGQQSRALGSDLIPSFTEIGPVEVFGHRTAAAADELLWEVARRRVYLHLGRWTAPGNGLVEAMQIGMPVLSVATTGIPEIVPSDAGVVSSDVERLRREFRMLLNEPEIARFMGRQARRAALTRFGLARFLDEWDAVLTAAHQGEHR